MTDTKKVMLTYLTRLVRRRPPAAAKLRRVLGENLEAFAKPAVDVALETGEPIGKVLAEVFAEHGDQKMAEDLETQVPIMGSTSLMRLHRALTQHKVDRLRAHPEGSTRQLIEELRNLARASSELAETDLAADLAEEAAVLARDLYRAEPSDDHLTTYGGALNTLAQQRLGSPRLCRVLDDPQGKVDVLDTSSIPQPPYFAVDNGDLSLEEAISAFRKANQPLLVALGLLNRADWMTQPRQRVDRMSRPQQLDEALEWAEEALRLIETESKTPSSEDFETANLHSVRFAHLVLLRVLTSLERHDEALEHGRKAHEMYLDVAEMAPDIHGDKLARFLRFYAIACLGAGHRAEALEHARDSVQRYRGLVQWRSDYTQDLAMALDALADCQKAEGNWRQSAKTRQEACDLYRKLQDGNPLLWFDNLSGSQMQLAECLLQDNRLDSTMKVLEDLIEAHKKRSNIELNHVSIYFRTLFWSAGLLLNSGHAEKAEPFYATLIQMDGAVLREVRIRRDDELLQLLFLAAVMAPKTPEMTPHQARIFQVLLEESRPRHGQEPQLKEMYLGSLEHLSHLAMYREDYAEAQRLAQEGAMAVLDAGDDALKRYGFYKVLQEATHRLRVHPEA